MTDHDFFIGVGPAIRGGWINENVSTFGSYYQLSVNGRYSGFIFSTPKAGQIDTVGFYVVAKASTGTSAGGYEIAIKTLLATGKISTVNYGGSSGTVLTIDDFDVGWNWVDLSQSATGTFGDIIGAEIKAIDVSATNYLRIAFYSDTTETTLPRWDRDDGWGSGRPIFAIRYNDGTAHGLPLSAFFVNNYDVNSTPDEVGAKFQVPVAMKCVGAAGIVRPQGSSANFTVLLYDSLDVELASFYVSDEDHVFFAGDKLAEFRWDGVSLAADTDYRLVLRPESSLNVYMSGYVFITGTYDYCVPEGERWMKTSRVNGGAWTEDEFSVPYLSIIADQITIPSTNGADTPASTGTNYYGWSS